MLNNVTFRFILLNYEISELNGGINTVFWGTVASSLLSVLFSATSYFSCKYQLQSAITTYAFSFEFRTDEFHIGGYKLQYLRHYKLVHHHWL